MKLLRYLNIIMAILIFVLMFSGLISCQKVITLDLNSPSPQLVIEGNISNQPGPYFVKLSKTVNFDNVADIPSVTGAYVEISDSMGNNEILTEVGSGYYCTTGLKGIPGNRYKLTVKTGDQIYEAHSFMPYPVDKLDLTIKREANNRPSIGGSGNNQTIRYQVNYEISDPVLFKNYYRFVVHHKRRELSSRRVFNDQYHNGKIIADEFGLNDSIDFKPGDTVNVELRNIDKGTFDFFRTLRDGASGLSFLSASPSNPLSDISNNALGYFSAYSVNNGIVIIPK